MSSASEPSLFASELEK